MNDIITIHLKDPDGFSEAIRLAVEDSVSSFTKDEQKVLSEIRTEKLEEELKPWVEYNEYITLQYDRKNKTLTVVKRNE